MLRNLYGKRGFIQGMRCVCVWPRFKQNRYVHFLHVPFIPTRNKFLKIFSAFFSLKAVR